MNDLKWFRIADILRYGFDLARIFPIIINHKGLSKFFSWIYSFVETQLTSWQHLINLEYQLQKIVTGLPTQVLESIF